MNRNRLIVSLVALVLLVAATLTIESSIATSATVPSGQALSNNALPHPGTVVERYFPGKAQDDLVTAAVAIDRRFPGKEKDDIVSPASALDRQFPGKAKDDLVAASACDAFTHNTTGLAASELYYAQRFMPHAPCSPLPIPGASVNGLDCVQSVFLVERPSRTLSSSEVYYAQKALRFMSCDRTNSLAGLPQ